ncbi:hypothetical protein L209DRAFT_156078 [Thermothelomyces heterothallicus CBS 203.75]
MHEASIQTRDGRTLGCMMAQRHTYPSSVSEPTEQSSGRPHNAVMALGYTYYCEMLTPGTREFVYSQRRRNHKRVVSPTSGSSYDFRTKRLFYTKKKKKLLAVFLRHGKGVVCVRARAPRVTFTRAARASIVGQFFPRAGMSSRVATSISFRVERLLLAKQWLRRSGL